MSVVWSNEVEQEFNNLWPCIAPTLRESLLKNVVNYDVGEYKTMFFNALTVWARQYAHMMVEPLNPSVKAGDVFYPFASAADAKARRTDPMFSEGVNPLETVKRVRCLMQLHQVSARCAIPLQQRNMRPDRRREAMACTECGNESTADRRARLSRVSYLEMCGERAKRFSEFALLGRWATWNMVQEPTSDGNDSVGGQAVIYMRVSGCVVDEEKVTLDTARTESVEDPNDIWEWSSEIACLNSEQCLMEELKRDYEQRAARVFGVSSGPIRERERVKEITADIARCKKKLEIEYVRIGRWIVKKRLEMFREVGYAYVGDRDGAGDGGWFCRIVPAVELAAIAEMSAEVDAENTRLRSYEVSRAKDICSTLQRRAEKFAKPHERCRGECKMHLTAQPYYELYHYEEALRCKVRTGHVAEDAPRPPQHAPSLPKIDQDTLDTLLEFPYQMNGITTPCESDIDSALVERAGLTHGLYQFNYPGYEAPSVITTKSEFTNEVANDAITRVMKVMVYMVANSRSARKAIVYAMSKLIKLQLTTTRAIAVANSFIQSSDAFWRTVREGQPWCGLLETLAAEDVLVGVLSHLYDAECYIALATTCKQFSKNCVLRWALPRLRTNVMTGPMFPGTIEPVDGVSTIRTNMLVGFNTEFGFYKPRLDGTDQWISLNMEKFTGGCAPGGGSVRVLLVYDEPQCPAVCKKCEPVLRMGTSIGNKQTGTFEIDNDKMHTPVKILTTSRSVNPIPKAVYDDMVALRQQALASSPTSYARKRLAEAVAARDRNKDQQCMRVRIVVERNGHTIQTISDPFVVVGNLTKARKKHNAKRQKTGGSQVL